MAVLGLEVTLHLLFYNGKRFKTCGPYWNCVPFSTVIVEVDTDSCTVWHSNLASIRVSHIWIIILS